MKQLLAVATLLGACGDNLPSPFGDPPSIEVVSMPVTPNRELDLLFLIDDSLTTPEFQIPLSLALPVLFDRLSVGGDLPSLHLGVATSDLGTAGSDPPGDPGPSIGQPGSGGCGSHGKDGALIRSGAPITDAFLIDEPAVDGTRRRNYPGSIESVARQMVLVGGEGCNYEQHFAAVRRALTSPANVGFLRASAQLAVVIVADEDDCSFRTARFLAPDEPLGPRTKMRCTQEGLRCNEPLDGPGIKTGCRARNDSRYVESLETTLAFLRGLKPDPSMLTVAAIAGPVAPFELGPLIFGATEVFSLYNSCHVSGPDTFKATNPAVRMRELVSSFDAHGLFASSCALSYEAQLRELSRLLQQSMGLSCLDTTQLRDSDTAAGVQPTCAATLVTGGAEEPLPACPTDGACFELVADAAACAESADHLRFVVHEAPPGAYVRARCEVP